jgi:peptide/nickel transport system permease protein
MAAIADASEIRQPGRLVLVLRYLRRNWSLTAGLIILLLLVAFTAIGFMTINPKHAYPLAAPPRRPPGWPYVFGTDFFGRDLFAAMVVGMWQTALIGIIAGGIGTGVGVILGFISAYFGGWTDNIIRSVCQILTPIPALLIQVVRPARSTSDVTSSRWPSRRGARLDVVDAGDTVAGLTMKERQYVAVALSGVSVSASSSGRSCRTCLSLLPPSSVKCSQRCSPHSTWRCLASVRSASRCSAASSGGAGRGAFFNGWWWWPIEPAVAMILILGSLALVNMGLDELANPRVRRSE